MKKTQTHNGRITLHDPAWYESGANLPATHNAGLPVNRMPQPQVPATPAPTPLTADDYRQIVIKVADLMKRPLQSLRVLDCFQRVYLVEFVPHFTVDPVLPVTFVPLGDKHDHAFQRLAELILSWDPVDTHHQQWYMQCKQYARPCLVAAFTYLTRDEAEWYGREMMYTLANPDRRNLDKPALTPSQQREQQFIERTGRRPYYIWER